MSTEVIVEPNFLVHLGITAQPCEQRMNHLDYVTLSTQSPSKYASKGSCFFLPDDRASPISLHEAGIATALDKSHKEPRKKVWEKQLQPKCKVHAL